MSMTVNFEMTVATVSALQMAAQHAADAKEPKITSPYVLLGLAEESCQAAHILQQLGHTPQQVREAVEEFLANNEGMER